MRRLASAIALACLLSGAAYAGEIHTTGATAPASPTETADGEIPTTGATEPDASTAVETIILTLLGIIP
jgi:hypothetical protein